MKGGFFFTFIFLNHLCKWLQMCPYIRQQQKQSDLCMHLLHLQNAKCYLPPSSSPLKIAFFFQCWPHIIKCFIHNCTFRLLQLSKIISYVRRERRAEVPSAESLACTVVFFPQTCCFFFFLLYSQFPRFECVSVLCVLSCSSVVQVFFKKKRAFSQNTASCPL